MHAMHEKVRVRDDFWVKMGMEEGLLRKFREGTFTLITRINTNSGWRRREGFLHELHELTRMSEDDALPLEGVGAEVYQKAEA